MTDIDSSEWTTPDQFQTLDFIEIHNHPLRLYNLNTSLAETKTSPYLTKSTGILLHIVVNVHSDPQGVIQENSFLFISTIFDFNFSSIESIESRKARCI